MTTTIDNRVVEMGFNNKQFESGVSATLRTLEKLRQGLKFDDAIKSFADLTGISKSFSLESMAKSIENVSSKFSIMGVAGFTVFQSLTQWAIGLAGKFLDIAFSIDQIKGGFGEYEQGIGSVATILANTASAGTTLEDVNRVLAEMLDYANKTVYSYGDMTTAIGKFTSQGVKLDTAAVAVKGIYNLVALTGGKSEEAYRVVYNLSQALGSGTVRLQDWMSLEGAGVANPDFQKQLAMTAKSFGIDVDAMIKSSGSLRLSLQSGWLTSDILLQTLAQYTGDLTKEELESMSKITGAAKDQAQAYGVFTENQLKSMGLTENQLNSLGKTWEDQANAISSMNDKQLIDFGLNEKQLAILGGKAWGVFTDAQVAALNLSDKQLKILGASWQEQAKSLDIMTVEQLKDLGLTNEQISKMSSTIMVQAKARTGYTEEEIKGIIALGQRASDSATKLKTFSAMMDVFKSNMVSGWSASFKIVFGDINQATDLWTFFGNSIGGVLQTTADIRNSILQTWADLGGRTALVNGLKNIFTGLLFVINPLIAAFKVIFPPTVGAQLFAFSKGFELLTQGFLIGSTGAAKFQRIFKGFFSIFKIVGEGIGILITSFSHLFKGVKISGSGILDFAAKIGDYLVKLEDGIRINNTFGKGIDKIKNFLKSTKPYFTSFGKAVAPVFEKIKEVISGLFKGLDFSGVGTFFSTLGQKLAPIGGILNGIGKGFSWLWGLIKGIGPSFSNLGNTIQKAFSGFSKGMSSGFSGIDIGTPLKNFVKSIGEALKKIKLKDIIDVIGVGLLGSLILDLKKFVQSGTGVMSSFKGYFESISGILDGVKGSLMAWQNSLKAKTLLTIASAIAILAVSLIALAFIPADKLSGALAAISMLFVGLVVGMNQLNTIGGKGGITKVAVDLVILSAAILILTTAVAVLGNMDPKKVTQGLEAVGTMLLGLAVFMKLIGKDFDVGKLGGLLLLGAALNSLAVSILIFGNMNPLKLVQGLEAVGAALAELAAFMVIMNFSKSFGPEQAAGILILAGALAALSISVVIFGNMDPKKLIQGLEALGAILLGLTGFILLVGLSKSTGLIQAAAGLAIMSLALVALTGAVFVLGTIEPNKLGQGIAALAALIGLLTLASFAMQEALPGAGAMIVMALALNLMVIPLMLLASVPWQGLLIGLGILAGVFVVFGLAALLLTPVVPVMFALAAAIALLGAAVLMAGVGVLAFGVGLAALVGIGVGGAKALEFVITSLAVSIANGIKVFLQTLAAAAPDISQALLTILDVMIATIILAVPKILETVIFLLIQVKETLHQAEPIIIQAAIDLLIALLTGIRDNLEQVIILAGEVIAALLVGLGKGLVLIIAAAFELLLAFINGLADAVDEYTPQIQDATIKLGKAIIKGISDSIGKGVDEVAGVIKTLATGALDALKKAFGINSPSKKTREVGDSVIGGLVDGMLRHASAIKYASEDISDNVISGISIAIAAISDALQDDMEMVPTIQPVIDLTNVISGGKQIDKLLSNKRINLSVSTSKLSSIASGMQTSNNSQSQINVPSQGTNVSFTQINNSPKALSAIEIYRQTRNQLNLVKGLVRQG